jgi:hypothetical protein
MFRSLFALLLAVAIFALPACDTEGNTADLGEFTLALTGFTPHIGHTMYFRLVNDSTGQPVAPVRTVEVTQADFSVTFPQVIDAGQTYHIDFFADVDDNGEADESPSGTPPGVDHTWRKSGTGTAAGLTINFAHDVTWQDITPFET